MQEVVAANWRSLIRPKRVEARKSTDTYGKFVVRPLERGFGITLGNALRRILLSSLQGAAIKRHFHTLLNLYWYFSNSRHGLPNLTKHFSAHLFGARVLCR